MEAILMSAGILTAIILSVVGLVKLPFDKFKMKHPKIYKAVFTLLSIVLTFIACVVNHLFILESKVLFNAAFVVMLLSTYAGVFGLYLSYEGLGAKELVKRLLNAIKNLKASAPESKLSKMIDKYGIELAVKVITAKQSEVTEVVVENAVVENQTINAQNVEINNASVQNPTINTQN